jgi:hypothetical protein
MGLKPAHVQVLVSVCVNKRERGREMDVPERMEEITSKVKFLVTSSGSVQFSEGQRSGYPTPL